MGVFFRSPKLTSGESALWDRAANREQAGWRTVGGRLTVTSSRVLFTANRFDAVLGGNDWATGRENVQGVGMSDRSLKGGPLTGGLRRRVRLTMTDGSDELFVVKKPDETAAELSRLLSGG